MREADWLMKSAGQAQGRTRTPNNRTTDHFVLSFAGRDAVDQGVIRNSRVTTEPAPVLAFFPILTARPHGIAADKAVFANLGAFLFTRRNCR